jgi:acyl-CoA synthetase (AMP-forming)/AMP-acid ligase II
MPSLHALTLGDLLRNNRRSFPDRPAVVCGTDRYSYVKLDDRVNRLADALGAEGVSAGDRVLWLGQNCHRVLELLLACAKIGAIFCPANWRQSSDEFAFVIDDVDPAVVVWQEEEIGPTVTAAREKTRSKARWFAHDTGEYEELLARGDAADIVRDVDPSAPVLMMYTAAFGGRPNGALLTHQGLLAQNLIMAAAQGVDSGYVYVNSGPLFHIATFMTTLATLHFGGNNVFMRRFDAHDFCQTVEREGVTGAFVVGAMMQEVVEANRDRTYNLKTLRTIGSAIWGIPQEWLDMTSPDSSPWATRPAGYGQTEVAGMATLNAIGDPGVGSHGRPSPIVQVRIVDAEDNEVPVGETGEIVVRGPTVMTGYWRRPELNAERQRGGWHHTSDLGRQEADGTISFIGPKTRMVKSAAENIYPIEVESCIREHPAVQDVVVIGVPDPKWTQSVKAVVVLKEGASADADEIIAHCKQRIASYKKPKFVEFADSLPRTNLGLVDRDAADAAFGGGGYPGIGGI